MSKKASLELSINAIVIIVMAFVLLGLGLTFIRGQITGMGDTTTQVQDQVRQQILEDLRAGDKKLSFPTTQIGLSTRDSTIIAFGVKNMQDSDLKFCVVIEDLSKLPDDAGLETCDSPVENTNKAPGEYCGGFNWDYTVQSLSAGESNVIGIKYFAPSRKLTYLYKLKIVEIDEDSVEDICDESAVKDAKEYTSRTFFANVV